MKNRVWLCLFSLATAVGFFTPSGMAAAIRPTDSILQQELKQQQIKATTQRVRDQLDLVIGEFERNAIAGADVGVLKAIRSVLGVLTEQDMKLVLEYLQKSREATDPRASAKEATEAYARQKAIITKLKALEAEYRRQAELYELSLRFKELANRQSRYMWQTRDLAKRTEGKSVTGFSDSQQSDLNLLQIDQAPMADELKPHLDRLERLTKDGSDGPTAERPKQALRQAKEGGLDATLQAAVTELKSGRLMSATGSQKKARDQFREVARLLMLAQGEIESIRQALRELEQAMEQQKQVMNDTRKLDSKDRDNKMETRQGEVVDTTDLIRRDVDSLAPVASEHLKAAIDKMQEARSVLDSEKDPAQQRQKAPPRQAEALAGMEQARRALQEQLAKAEADANRPEDALAALKDLQEKVRDIATVQAKLNNDTSTAEKKDLSAFAPKQGDLKDRSQEVQSQAASQSPAAAHSLGEAANQMQKSQASLANSQNNAPAQQAAIDALKKAEQQLGQEISRLEQAQKDLVGVEQLLNKLGDIIQDQQKVQLDTAREALKPNASPMPEVAGKQQQLASDTAQLHQEASSLVPNAATNLAGAKDHMGEAKTALDKPAPKQAQPKQTEALAELYTAKKKMENKADELRNMLGQPTDPSAQALADASQIIEQAQQNVNQAMENLQQSPPGLMESLLQQQQQIANSLAQMPQASQPSSPVNDAQKAANQAGEKLEQNNLPAAVEAMQKAEDSMQKAMQAGQQGQAAQPPSQHNAPPAQLDQQGQQQNGQSPSEHAQPGQQTGESALPQLAQQQSEVKKTAEQLLAAQKAAPASAMAQAAEALNKANDLVRPLVAGEAGTLPGSAQAALQSAQGSLANGAAQAQSGQSMPAQSSAAAAAQTLAQAQAALSLAQSGMGSGQKMANAGQAQGQGQAHGQAQQGQGQGQGKSQGPGQANPSPQGTGRMGNWAGAGGADGPRRNTTGPGAFMGLPNRDRAALKQSQAERYPQEYGSMVEQYLKNLSDQVK